MRRLPLILSLSLAFAADCAAQPPDHLSRRWFLFHTNLLVDRNVTDALSILDRAAAAGYNGVAIDDFKFYLLDRMDQRYFDNARRVIDHARALKLTVAACCMSLGWASGTLYHNPNLAEGIPVKDQPYVVENGALRPVHDPQLTLPGGDFERVENGKLVGWDFYDEPGKLTFPDTQVVHGGRTAVRMERSGDTKEYANCRVMKRVPVQPFHYYRLSAWIKTEDFAATGAINLHALTGDPLHALAFPDLGVKRTQDWTQVRTVFNSQTYDSVGIYLGVWGITTGKLWWDDVTIEECGPLNILRRPTTPLVIKAQEGTAYEEGRDFEKVEDPQLGHFDQVHEAPVIKLAANSRLRDGQTVLLSFYHPGIIGTDDVMCCFTEPQVYDILQDQVRRIQDLIHPDMFFMGHDEIRCANWDPPCQARGLTPGQLLADNVKRCTKMIREVAPKAEIAVWSDMFDPLHNAGQEPYYLVNGSWQGSWEGLDPSIIIMNWYSEPAPKNNQFFADRGHPQMLCGYYDRSPGDFYDPAWLAKTKDVSGILGVMYTPWSTGYGNLEAWAQAVWGGRR